MFIGKQGQDAAERSLAVGLDLVANVALGNAFVTEIRPISPNALPNSIGNDGDGL